MRSSKSRSRGNKNRNSNRPTGGNIINRVFDSSGPDGKVRGTPQQIIEKYNQLHRDAQLSGDRVAAENFSQHAEHYTRMLAEAMLEVDKARDEQEQFNRERQAERDRERNDRLRQQEETSNGGSDQPADNRDQTEPRDQHQREPRPDNRSENRQDNRQDNRQNTRNEPRQDRAPRQDREALPSFIEKPTFVDSQSANKSEPAEAELGLVETPEGQSKPRRPRGRKPQSDAAPQAADPSKAAE